MDGDGRFFALFTDIHWSKKCTIPSGIFFDCTTLSDSQIRGKFPPQNSFLIPLKFINTGYGTLATHWKCHLRKEPEVGTPLVRRWYGVDTKEVGRPNWWDKGTLKHDCADQLSVRFLRWPWEDIKYPVLIVTNDGPRTQFCKRRLFIHVYFINKGIRLDMLFIPFLLRFFSLKIRFLESLWDYPINRRQSLVIVK